MKQILILVWLTALMAFMPARPEHKAKEKWVVLKGCSLKIAGSTNVNKKFRCEVKNYLGPDTLQVCGSDKEHAIPVTGSLDLPVLSFDCFNNMMTNDLRKTLKAEEYPNMQISFLSLGKYPALQNMEEEISGAVCITLAGVAKTFIVNYRISMDDQKIIHLTGTQNIKFSDFGLEPPRKMGGAVKAKDKLDVEFRINLRAI